MFAYLTYGSNVLGNVLKNLPSASWYALIANAGMSVVCIGVYPLMIMPMVAPLESAKTKVGVVIIVHSIVVVGVV